MKEMDLIELSDWGCLTNSHRHHHNINGWAAIDYNRTEASLEPTFLHGTTIWINEHMAVGHMMYDIAIIQALKSAIPPVDRIILQRTACNDDHCLGLGTWDGWYKGYYTAMISAFRPGIPIYVRWSWKETHTKPIFLDGNAVNTNGENADLLNNCSLPEIHMHNWKCAERLIRRRCYACFTKGISEDSVVEFKASAYKLIHTLPPLQPYFSPSEPLVVAYAYRGPSAGRHMENNNLLIDILTKASLSQPNPFVFRPFHTSNYSIPYQEQIDLVARSHIVISEHGAFQSNLVYMRNASLLIDLRGPYGHGEFDNFASLARIFGVFFHHVFTRGLISHREKSFNITQEECDQVVEIVQQYFIQKPYSLNMYSPRRHI